MFKFLHFSNNYSIFLTKFKNKSTLAPSFPNINFSNLDSLKNWLQLFDNYAKIVDYRKSVKSGKTLAHKFSSLPIRCHGCGSFFHTCSKDKRGFISHEDLFWLMKNAISFYDARCHNCKNTEQSKLLYLSNKSEYKNELKFLEKKPTLYLHVIDVCNLSDSMDAEYYRKCHKESNIIFVANKIDRLPRDVINLEETLVQEINSCGKWNMDSIIDIVLLSCKTYFGVFKLFKLLKNVSLDRDVCIVGKSNVGKSSLFNMIQNVIYFGNYRMHEKKLLPIQSSVGYTGGVTTGLIRHPISSHYLAGGYRYLRMLEIKKKNEEKFEVDQEINQSEYTIDMSFMNEIFSGEEKSINIDPKYETYVNKCIQSNALDYKRFHQSNSIHTTQQRVDFLNPDVDFDHNKHSWLYDTPSFTNNIQNEELYANYSFEKSADILSLYENEEFQIKELDVKNDECIQYKHIKLKSDSEIWIKDLINIKIKSFTLNNFIENNTNDLSKGESKHLDFFFFLPFKFSECVNLNKDVENLENTINYKNYSFEFYGQGFSKVAVEIDLNSLGWISIFGPLNTIVDISVFSKEGIFKPTIRTIPLIEQRPKKCVQKSFLSKYNTIGNFHNIESEIGTSIRKHVLYTKAQRDYQISKIQDYFINYQPRIHSLNSENSKELKSKNE